MKTKAILFALVTTVALPTVCVFSQYLTLTFSANNNGEPVSLESVWVKNLSRFCDTTLIAPDLTLVIDTLTTGIPSHLNQNTSFTVSQNYPNPFTDHTFVDVSVPRMAPVQISVYNTFGQEVFAFSSLQKSGTTTYKINPGTEHICLLSVSYEGHKQSIRMIATGNETYGKCSISTVSHKAGNPVKSTPGKYWFDFKPGDRLLYVGYIDEDESGLLDSPHTNKDYVFEFATNIPCPGLDSLFYEGQWYHTIQIYSQCWMKENLNAGVMIQGNQFPSNNGIIEKYCFANNENNCNEYGGLYIWDELMQYSTGAGCQGICPSGWHVPTDEEWKVLEGAVDSQCGIGNSVWNGTMLRGTDAGYNLKSSSGWNANNNGCDLFGFTVLPSGYWWENWFFELTTDAILWTSSCNNAQLTWQRGLSSQYSKIYRGTYTGIVGNALRCLKNDSFKDVPLNAGD